jgi:glyoxylase-like metal-dependent hydrolase (beta-lactamase superfamily II)
MPRSAVLDASLDPTPSAPYVMSHPSFVLEWADGRMFLIDAGMDHDSAVAFGRPIEWLSGGEPIQPLISSAERLGAALTRVEGIAFTHEHTDHTRASPSCVARAPPIPLFQNPLQIQKRTSRRAGQRQLVEAGCLESKMLESGPLFAVPDSRACCSSPPQATHQARRCSSPTCGARTPCAPGSSPATS